jgi:hypothetical protein
MAVSLFARARGAGGPPSTGRSPGHTWTPSHSQRGVRHRGTMGTHADSTVPSCRRRLRLSLRSCGVTGNLGTRGRCSNAKDCLLWACAQPQTRQPFANWNTAVFISSRIIQYPSARHVCQHQNRCHNGIDSFPRVCARPSGRSSLPMKAPEDLSRCVPQRPTSSSRSGCLL